VDYLFIMKFVQ